MNHKKFTTDDLVKINQIYKRQKQLKYDIKDLEEEFFEITTRMKTLGCIIDGRIEDSNTRNLRIGIKKFNHNPQEGIEYLISKKAIPETPKSVASFLTNKSLNKKAVGDYLGNISKPFNCNVLQEYISLFDFTEMEFIDSIRFFLSGFHLPGESQKIDKIISLWANYYHEQNPSIFKNENETYIMTYAVIMLNTCLHNPTAKKENGGFGREEDFIKIMGNFNSDTQFELSFVKKIFKNIKSNPLSCLHKHSPDHSYKSDIDNVEKSGWLWKQGGRIKNMKKRWFVLSEYSLFYFIHPNSHLLKGMIPLENLLIRIPYERSSKPCFEIYSDENEIVKGCKSKRSGQIIRGHHYSYKIYCFSREEMESWIDAIQRSINLITQMKLVKDIE